MRLSRRALEAELKAEKSLRKSAQARAEEFFFKHIEAEGRASIYRTERDHYSQAAESIKDDLARAEETIFRAKAAMDHDLYGLAYDNLSNYDSDEETE